MPLSSSGIAAGQIIKSAEVLQFFNLLTGVMTDQTVNIANQVVCNSLSVAGIAGDTSINKGGRLIGAVNGVAPTGGPYVVGDTVIDRTNGTLMVCTAAGSPGTWNIVGGSGGTLAVGAGGTGRTSFTAHGVLLGNATNGLNVTAVGATNTVLHGNSGADPSYSQVTGSDIAGGTITGGNIANATITATQLANPVMASGQTIAGMNNNAGGGTNVFASTTITTHGRPVIALASIGLSCSADTNASLLISSDLVAAIVVNRFQLRSGSTANTGLCGFTVFTGVSAGSHTFTASWLGVNVTADGGSIVAFELT